MDFEVTGGIYTTNSAYKLFELLQRKFIAFADSPSEDALFDLIFPLYHLREWICPDKYTSYKNKPLDQWSREERLHSELYIMDEYRVIQDICNAAKHFIQHELEGRLEILEGLRVGLMRAGDSLDMEHFVVDGRDIRDFIWPVYRKYYLYFDTLKQEPM